MTPEMAFLEERVRVLNLLQEALLRLHELACVETRASRAKSFSDSIAMPVVAGSFASTIATAAKPRHKLSVKGRVAIRSAQRKRWAKVRAAAKAKKGR
jgi:hypothetical protein